MVILGHIGTNEMAAVGVANQVYFMFLVFGLGTKAAIGSLVAGSGHGKAKWLPLSAIPPPGVPLLLPLISRMVFPTRCWCMTARKAT